jgi:hypothetical protein
MPQEKAEVQFFTRLTKKDAKRLRAAAEADERKPMVWLRRLVVAHLDSLEKGQ